MTKYQNDDKTTIDTSIVNVYMNDIMPLLQHLHNQLSTNHEGQAVVAEIHAQYLSVLNTLKSVVDLMNGFSVVADEMKFQRDVLARRQEELERLIMTRGDAVTVLANVVEIDELLVQRAIERIEEYTVTRPTMDALITALDMLVEEAEDEAGVSIDVNDVIEDAS